MESTNNNSRSPGASELHAPPATHTSSAPTSTDQHREVLTPLGDLLAHVVHAAKNQLGPLKGYASLIQDANEDGTNNRRWADKIIYSIESTEKFLNDLSMLRLSGRETDDALNWNDLLAETAAEIDPMGKSGVAVDVSVGRAGEFRQNYALVRKMMHHIIRNAVEASEGGSTVTIRVSNRRSANEGRRRVAVTVEDSGRGIAPEMMEAMWSPFQTNKSGHLGLGLAFVSVAANAIGADVVVDTEADTGTTVTVLFEEGEIR